MAPREQLGGSASLSLQAGGGGLLWLPWSPKQLPSRRGPCRDLGARCRHSWRPRLHSAQSCRHPHWSVLVHGQQSLHKNKGTGSSKDTKASLCSGSRGVPKAGLPPSDPFTSSTISSGSCEPPKTPFPQIGGDTPSCAQ